jgi:integrase
MSCYFIRGKGWRYDFTLNGKRHTETWFKTKKEARKAEEEKRQELSKPVEMITTDTAFLDLVNRRLDYVKAYNSDSHYDDSVVFARRWVNQWGDFPCSEVTTEAIETFLLNRKEVSVATANKELRLLKAMFNFGLKKKLVRFNPTTGIESFPEEKRVRYVPPLEDINKVLSAADRDTNDYLWLIGDTLARMNEINRLSWPDIDFANTTITLYTRKKKGGHLTPRQVPMTADVFKILIRRYHHRDESKPWVFWHRYKSRKTGTWVEGPFNKRNKLMPKLCTKAKVKRFGFHALRHAGASLMAENNVPIGAIQTILGHENRSTTEIYVHTAEKTAREAMATYEKARQSLT